MTITDKICNHELAILNGAMLQSRVQI